MEDNYAVGDHEQIGTVRLEVTVEPSTSKKQRIVHALFESLREVPYDGNLGEFTSNLVSEAYDKARDMDVNTQKAYVWQVYGECLHTSVDESRAEDGECSDEDHRELAEVIRELDDEQYEWFEKGKELDDEQYIALQRGRQYAKTTS